MSRIAAGKLTSVEEINFNNYYFVAILALIVYEHILTSGDEIRLKWGYRRLIVAICFYLNRLTLLALGITGLLLVLPWKHKMSCNAAYGFYVSCQLCIIAITAAVSAFRTYLAGNRSWCLAGVALAFGLVPVGTNLYRFSRVSVEFSVDHGIAYCEGNFKLSTTEEDRIIIATRACAIACDATVILVTWSNMYSTVRVLSGETQLSGRGLSWLMLRDGSLYFIALLLLNVIDMVTYYLNHLIGNLTAFILPLSSVLISRLLFNLRDATHRYEEGNTPSLACTISDTAYPSFDAERQAWHIKIEDAEQRYDSDDELFDDDEFMDDDATLCDTTRQRVCDPLNTV